MKSQMNEQERAIWNAAYAQSFALCWDGMQDKESRPENARPMTLMLAAAEDSKERADMAVFALRGLRRVERLSDAGLNIDSANVEELIREESSG